MISKLVVSSVVRPAAVCLRRAGVKGPVLPVRHCHRNVEDRTKWSRQGQGLKMPTFDKKTAEQFMDYWRPYSKKWLVDDIKVSDTAPWLGVLAVAVTIPVMYYFWRSYFDQPPVILPDPAANKSPFSPRPKLVSMRDVRHDVSGCPNADPAPCPDPQAMPQKACAPLQPPCPPKVVKPCSETPESKNDTPLSAQVMTNTGQPEVSMDIIKENHVASSPSL